MTETDTDTPTDVQDVGPEPRRPLMDLSTL